MDFNNKTVWITGASSGIGEALTYQFANLGAKLIISARRTNELERVKDNCKYPEKVSIYAIDLADHEGIVATAEQVLAEHGTIDILINNGGISQRSLTKDTSFETDKKIMDINYFGTIRLTKSVLPKMLEKKQGHIVVMSSLTGKFGAPQRSAYAASKHALHGFFDTLRAESWNDNINVTLVCAGYVQTNIAKNALNNKGESRNEEDPNIAKGMTPEYLAKNIINAIVKKKNELIIGGKEAKGVLIKRLFPNLFAKIVRKQKG